jgi:hypothetical protein
MNMLRFLQTGLLLHIIGLTILVGTTLSSYVLQKQFRKEYKDKHKGLALMQLITKLQRLSGIGLGLQILSGIMMLAATGGGYGQQLWFKIKMMLVILIITGTVALNRSLQNRLHKLWIDGVTDGPKDQQIGKIAIRINYVQLFLLAFFMIIFILSVFKFN